MLLLIDSLICLTKIDENVYTVLEAAVTEPENQKRGFLF
jgi:hypothetical protein